MTRLYAFADLRQLGDPPAVSTLSDFQRRHKHLLMTYNQEKMRQLGAIAANQNDRTPDTLYAEYTALFRDALSDEPDRSAYVNSLEHMYSHFKSDLSETERRE
ncbi:MAG: DUF1722 domain-containing protein, partial [Bradymonadaceae bacterium]